MLGKSLAVLVGSAALPGALAFHDHAHMLCGRRAEHLMDPKNVEIINKILAYWESEFPGMSTIATGTVWADVIKCTSDKDSTAKACTLKKYIPALKLMDNWHYFNNPVYLDGFTPADVPEFPDLGDAHMYIQDPLRTFSDSNNAFSWNFALRMFLHVFSDVHQVVGHAAGTFTPDMPTGDTGANNYVFLNDREPAIPCDQNNMHGYWDSVAGLYCKSFSTSTGPLLEGLDADLAELDAKAKSNKWTDNLGFAALDAEFSGETKYDYKTVQAKVFEVLDDSKSVATSVGFNQTLIDLTCVEKDGAKCKIHNPTEEYIAAAQTAGQREISVCGERMAHILNIVARQAQAKFGENLEGLKEPAIDAEESIKLNIHIKTNDDECHKLAVDLNKQVTELMGEVPNLSDFGGKNDPHITIYQTDFKKQHVDAIIKAVEGIRLGEPCIIELEPVVDTGTGYLFWDPSAADVVPGTRSSACLRDIADRVVEATKAYIVTPTEDKKPKWIADLADPKEREEKTAAYFNSGSPNTGPQFNPHITLASYPSGGAKADFTAIAAKVGNHKCKFSLDTVALGNTGPGGTVMTGQDEVAVNVHDKPAFECPPATESIKLNIHIKTNDDECHKLAVDLNKQVTELMGEVPNLSDFGGKNDPHITIYQTDFLAENVDAVKKAVEMIRIGEPCMITLEPVVDTGTGYLFWDPAADDVEPGTRSSKCLRDLADRVVEATKEYIVTPTEEKKPKWIADLADPKEREEKTAAYFNSGSPNTGPQFNPHITLASYPSGGAKANFTDIAAKVGNHRCTFSLTTVALGNTGPGGTVMSGKDEVQTRVSDPPHFLATCAAAESAPSTSGGSSGGAWDFNTLAIVLTAVAAVLLIGNIFQCVRGNKRHDDDETAASDTVLMGKA